PLSISIDNQASILAGESFYLRPGSYLADHFCRIMNKVAKDNIDFSVLLRWVPGHSGIHSNEELNKHAKLAAEGRQSNSPRTKLPHYLCHHSLLLSISALQEMQSKATNEHWVHLWHRSPWFYKLNNIDPHI
ncbi:hypothetical protein BDR07DRAFT_1203603, partial [Suillus spraguei]